MTAESLPPSAFERRDIKTPDGFLYELFDRTQRMIEFGKEAKIVAELSEQRIIQWFSYSDYIHKTSHTPFDMKKGLILRNDGFDYALAIGNIFPRYGDEGLSVEFGLIPHSERDFEETLDKWNQFSPEKTRDEKALSYLTAIATQYGFAHGSARIYMDERSGKIRTDCWADGFTFGGPELGRWEQERILTEGGLETSVDLFKQIAERAWR